MLYWLNAEIFYKVRATNSQWQAYKLLLSIHTHPTLKACCYRDKDQDGIGRDKI